MDELREKLYNNNVSIYKLAIQHWNNCNAVCIFCFDTKNDPKELVMFLTEPIKKSSNMIQYLHLKVRRSTLDKKIKGCKLCKRSFTKKQKEAEDLHKYFHL